MNMHVTFRHVNYRVAACRHCGRQIKGPGIKHHERACPQAPGYVPRQRGRKQRTPGAVNKWFKPAKGRVRSRRPVADGAIMPDRKMLAAYTSFDDETFGQIRGLATKSQVSFAEMVRQLVEWGLMSMEEEAHG